MTINDEEREILFAIKEVPRLQDVPGYSVNLFVGPRKRLAEAIFDLSNSDLGKPIDEGLLSIKSELSLAELAKEFEGCYRLTEAAFKFRVHRLILHLEMVS